MIKNEYLKREQMKPSQAEEGHEVDKARVKDDGESIGERRGRVMNFNLSKFLIKDARVPEDPKEAKTKGKKSPTNQREEKEMRGKNPTRAKAKKKVANTIKRNPSDTPIQGLRDALGRPVDVSKFKELFIEEVMEKIEKGLGKVIGKGLETVIEQGLETVIEQEVKKFLGVCRTDN